MFRKIAESIVTLKNQTGNIQSINTIQSSTRMLGSLQRSPIPMLIFSSPRFISTYSSLSISGPSGIFTKGYHTNISSTPAALKLNELYKAIQERVRRKREALHELELLAFRFYSYSSSYEDFDFMKKERSIIDRKLRNIDSVEVRNIAIDVFGEDVKTRLGDDPEGVVSELRYRLDQKKVPKYFESHTEYFLCTCEVIGTLVSTQPKEIRKAMTHALLEKFNSEIVKESKAEKAELINILGICRALGNLGEIPLADQRAIIKWSVKAYVNLAYIPITCEALGLLATSFQGEERKKCIDVLLNLLDEDIDRDKRMTAGREIKEVIRKFNSENNEQDMGYLASCLALKLDILPTSRSDYDRYSTILDVYALIPEQFKNKQSNTHKPVAVTFR